MSPRMLTAMAVMVVLSNSAAVAFNVRAGLWWYLPLNVMAMAVVVWSHRRYRASMRDLAAMRQRWRIEDAEQ